MEIRMAGVDFGKAALEQREALAFTKTQAVSGMHEALRQPGVAGCVIYSTCNRTELWLCAEDSSEADPRGLLCALKGVGEKQFFRVLTQRRGAAAVRHLFETACGLHSRIWGEDQIITQVRDAAQLAVNEGTAGKILGKLFQTAVTCAKKVKTQVRFSAGGSSVATAAVARCEELRGPVKGLRCLVIGSGNMGFLAARALISAGAEVEMTLRRYKYGVSAVPEHCGAVPYDDRMEKIADADLVFSATASPHYTLRSVPVGDICAKNPKPRIFVDLAVPRDMESAIGEIPGCRLLTIDDIPCGVREEERARTEARCRQIIGHYIGEFEKQLLAWSSLPAIRNLSEELAAALERALVKELEQTGLSTEQRLQFGKTAKELIRKKAGGTLFAFRDWMAENTGDAPEADAAETAR